MKIKVKDKKQNVIQSYLTGDHLGSGETANVYRGCLEGQESDMADIAIKLAKESKFNIYIKKEFDVLEEMRKVGGNGAAFIPSDIAFGETEDGRNALVMKPVLRQSLNQVFGPITDVLDQGKLALRAARQYVDLLKLIVSTDRSCQDKKLSDFWWIGNPAEGNLIVTDWNVIADSENQPLDIRRFGLLWYELIIGRQLRKDIVLTRDDYDDVRVQPGYGLYYLIGRCISTSFGSQFRTISELSQFISELSRLYETNAHLLVKEARKDLASLDGNVDRSKADMAWIKFDLATKMGESNLGELEDAKQWAKNPLEKYVPALFETIKSPNFSNVKPSLDKLKASAHGYQEVGDVGRLVFIFNILRSVMDRHSLEIEKFGALQKGLADIGLALQGQKKDIKISRSSMIAILPLMSQDANLHLELRIIENEIQFWELRGKVQDSPPADYFNKLIELRHSIPYLPESYPPSVVAIDDEKAAAETQLKLRILSDEREKSIGVIDRSYRNKMSPWYFDRFNRWEETVQLVTYLRKENMQDHDTKEDMQLIISELRKKNEELAKDRKTLQNVEMRVTILKNLLDLTKAFPEEFKQDDGFQENLDDLTVVKQKIQQAQNGLFTNAELILKQANKEGYEIFDIPGLSVATLIILTKTGQWDKEKFEQEIKSIRIEAEHFQDLVEFLETKSKELRELHENYNAWESDVQKDANEFFIKTLRLYLASAWANIDDNKDANENLNKAKSIIDFLSDLIDAGEIKQYQELYEHLIKLSKKKTDYVAKQKNYVQKVQTYDTNEEFELWFNNREFEKIKLNVDKLLDDQQKSYWENVILAKGIIDTTNDILNGKFENLNYSSKAKTQILENVLNTLQSLATNKDTPYINEYFKDDINRNYALVWGKLEKLDKKSAENFRRNLGVG